MSHLLLLQPGRPRYAALALLSKMPQNSPEIAQRLRPPTPLQTQTPREKEKASRHNRFPDATETDSVVLAARCVPVAAGDPNDPRVIAPGTATQNPGPTGRGPGRIRHGTIRIAVLVVPVVHPFEHVSQRVQQAELVRPEAFTPVLEKHGARESKQTRISQEHTAIAVLEERLKRSWIPYLFSVSWRRAKSEEAERLLKPYN